MKRIIVLFLTVILSFFTFSCGEFQDAINKPGEGNYSGLAEQPKLDNDPTNDFTVRLRLNGDAYIPTVAVNVYWNDGYNIHIAPIDKNGVATIDGLDGDYAVTLSAAPSGYAYDPNAYTATNDNRNIVIDMYDSGAVSDEDSENNIWNSHQVNTTGVYTVTVHQTPVLFKSQGVTNEYAGVVYFEFAPTLNGTYTVESWVNTTDDDVNPVCIAYSGSSQYKFNDRRIAEVGACGSYTRNFIHTVQIADENIGSSGSQSFSFAIGAETKSGVYPVTFSFAIKRNGGFDLGRPTKNSIVPMFDWSDFDFDAFNALAGGKRVGAEIPIPGTRDYVFAEKDPDTDEYNYKVWEKKDGGDGVYHVYDKEKYAATGGYGPILFAYINQACRYLEKPIANMYGVGNPLTVSEGTEDYQQFIRGFIAIAGDKDDTVENGAGYYCSFNCPCHADGSPLACLAGCETCLPTCQPCPPELYGKKGYAELCNNDGVVPVTPELKDFLQKFSIQRKYFADGEGGVERNGIYAYEDSQWLFACGYYE